MKETIQPTLDSETEIAPHSTPPKTKEELQSEGKKYLLTIYIALNISFNLTVLIPSLIFLPFLLKGSKRAYRIFIGFCTAVAILFIFLLIEAAFTGLKTASYMLSFGVCTSLVIMACFLVRGDAVKTYIESRRNIEPLQDS